MSDGDTTNIKVLKLNKIHLEFFGVLLIDDQKPKFVNKILKFFINLTFLTFEFCGLGLTSALYIYHNSNNVAGIVDALIPACACLTTLGCYSGLIINAPSIKVLNDELQKIIDSGK